MDFFHSYKWSFSLKLGMLETMLWQNLYGQLIIQNCRGNKHCMHRRQDMKRDNVDKEYKDP